MAIVEIKIPSPGESITHVELTRWLVKDGVVVKKDSEIAELESEKATLMLVAQETGKISLNVTEGASIKVGDVACTIDTSVQYEASLPSETKPLEKPTGEALLNGTDATPGLSGMKGAISTTELTSTTETTRITASGPISPPKTTLNTLDVDNKKTTLSSEQISDNEKVKITPLAKKVMMDNNLSLDDVIKGLKRLRREDVEAVLQASEEVVVSGLKKPANRESSRERLSSLRRKLSERLVSVKNETAMLTTFNEVDMKPIMDLRKKYQSRFVEKHGIKLGIMSFFLKACSVALLEYPKVNGMLDGEDMVTFDYTDISVAVSAPKGLMVPVIRNVESLGLAEIERVLEELAAKARSGRLSIAEMSGGTFTVTNGGVFGSMMSTPLINPPQSAILGMHNIIERPVAIDGQVVIRPMMYVALSYDHRVIDGKDSVGFLVRVKQLLENPTDLLFGGSSADKILLEL